MVWEGIHNHKWKEAIDEWKPASWLKSRCLLGLCLEQSSSTRQTSHISLPSSLNTSTYIRFPSLFGALEPDIIAAITQFKANVTIIQLTQIDEQMSPSPNLRHLRPNMTEPSSSGTVQLCEPCSRLDFKSMFTSHRLPASPFRRDPMCNCENSFNDRKRHGWPTPGDPTTTTCAFCVFYLECQIQSQDIQNCRRITSESLSLQRFHSLLGQQLRRISKDHGTGDCVQDVSAMQINRAFYPPELLFGKHGHMHAILRLLDHDNDLPLIRDRETGGGILARKLIRNKVNYRLIREWLQLCQSGHMECDSHKANEDDVNGEMDLIPGFQVIDCTTKTIVPFTSISGNTSSGEQSKAPEYVTLSYVWGQAPYEGPVIRQQQLSLLHPLPLTISDTIQVVQRLGYRYLWVDRYCIPQDDLPAKQIQIQNMGRIFSRSVVTIIAAAGEGPEYGLPGVSERRRAEQLTVQVGKGISLALYEMPKVTIGDSKWSTRGWTYQEGLLSRRRLVFTDQMVYFQCYEMHGDEVLLLPIPDKPSGKDLHFDEIRCLSLDDERSNFGTIFPRRMTDWLDSNAIWGRIEEFSRRQLSFDTDTIDAVDGIFGMYTAENRNRHPDDKVSFFYGMPIIPFLIHGRCSDYDFRTLGKMSVNEPGNTDPNPNVELGVNIKSSLTYKLACNLLWIDDWDNVQLTGNDDPSRSQFRRLEFPSWTWAGWKCTPRGTSWCESPLIFNTRTRIYIEYELEVASPTSSSGLTHVRKAKKWRRLDWECDNKEIQELARKGAYKIPARLVIRGAVLNVRLNWCDKRPKKQGCWTFTWPDCIKGSKAYFPKVLLGDTQPGDRSSQEEEDVHALALILAVAKYGISGWYLAALILKPVTIMSNGQPETMYERVYLKSWYLTKIGNKDRWTPLCELLKEVEVTIC